jgi:LysR family transcriptional regulator, cyn operon transcriptional activator
MQLRHIRYLLAVAEYANFTRAAEALHVSQPTLSQQIMQLEDWLGVQLLDRSGRTVKVTDAGREYIEHARRALRELEAGRRAVHDVQDLSRGILRLATTPTFTAYLVGPLVADFSDRYPGIALKLKEMPLDTIAAAVADDEVDLGIAFQVERAPDVECQPLFMEKLNVVVGAQHRFASRDTAVTPSEVGSEQLGLLSSDFATRLHVDAYLREQRISPRIAIEANTISALIEIVRRGHIATILPDAIGKQYADLKNINVRPEIPQRLVTLLSRKDSYQSAAAVAFAEMVGRYSVIYSEAATR